MPSDRQPPFHMEPEERAELYLALLQSWRELSTTFGSMTNAQVSAALAGFFLTHHKMPSVSKIADLTSLSRRTVLRALQSLEGQGYLIKVHDQYLPTPMSTRAGEYLAPRMVEIFRRLRPVCDRIQPLGD